jgi:hypothetical protein
MAYYETIKLVSGDTEPELIFTLRDANKAATIMVEGQSVELSIDEDDPSTWAVLDLTNKVVTAKFRELGGETSVILPCTIDDNPATGKATMHWTAEEGGTTALDVSAGTYEAEIAVAGSDGSSPQTVVDRFKFKVRDAF